MKDFLDKFLKNVAWPAVAGNVAWSFATLAIEGGINLEKILRLVFLFVLAVYLSAEWYRSDKICVKDITVTCLNFDLLFVCGITWLAIATQANRGAPGIAFLIILFGVGIGHLLGVWPPAGDDKGNIPHGWTCLSVGVVLGILWFWKCSWMWGLERNNSTMVLLTWGAALLGLSLVLTVWTFNRRGKS